MNTQRIVGAGTQNVGVSDIGIDADTTLGSTSLVLPSIATVKAYKQTGNGSNLQPIEIFFKNIGTANNPIVVTAAAGDTVNGLATVSVGATGANGTAVATSDNTWLVLFAPAS